jgi:site-specific recombinase XerC
LTTSNKRHSLQSIDRTGGNLKAVQRLLGHADISTTGNIYIDWDVDQLAETLEQIGDD